MTALTGQARKHAMRISRFYPILDAACFADTDALCAAADELVSAGITVLQYRNKSGNAREMLEQARELKRRVGGASSSS